MKIDLTLTPLKELLRTRPNHMLVFDEVIAVLMPDDQLLLVGGDFRDITEEEANLKLQEVLRKMQ